MAKYKKAETIFKKKSDKFYTKHKLRVLRNKDCKVNPNLTVNSIDHHIISISLKDRLKIFFYQISSSCIRKPQDRIKSLLKVFSRGE